MANHKILIDTANTYKHRAENDSIYVLPSKVLNGVVRELGLTEKSSSTEIKNSEQYVVVRTQEMPDKPELIRQPLSLPNWQFLTCYPGHPYHYPRNSRP